MLVIFYGTTGELIKLAPLLKAVPREDYILVNTVQQAQQLAELQRQLDISDDFKLANGFKGRDLETYLQVLRWLPVVAAGYFKNRRRIRRRLNTSTKHMAIVHGDTNTTVIGAFFGRVLRLPVGHVEAGLRSFDLMHPFPEEINRRIVTRLARYHFAPGKQPVKNLRYAKGVVVDTKYNTVKDSIRLVASAQGVKLPIKPPDHFGVISIHRNELLSNKSSLEAFLKALDEPKLRARRMIFLDHPVTRERLRNLGFDHYLERKHIVRIPKLDYPTFMKLLAKADFVLTDSGGLQEECTYLNIPCVVHRKVTERREGLGYNVELTGMNAHELSPTLDKLLARIDKRKPINYSPTKVMTSYMSRNGFISEELKLF